MDGSPEGIPESRHQRKYKQEAADDIQRQYQCKCKSCGGSGPLKRMPENHGIDKNEQERRKEKEC